MRQVLLVPALAAGIFAVSASAQAQTTAAALPQGEGRDIVAVACTQCHQVTAFTQLRTDAQAWRFRVDDMVLRGAQIGPDDLDKVVGYLSTSFGPGVPFLNAAPVAVTLADGQGKDLVEGACQLCHGLDRAVAVKRPAREWAQTVEHMAFLGAPIDADQQKTIVAYLSAQYGSK